MTGAHLFCPDWLQIMVLLISASLIASTAGISPPYPALTIYVFKGTVQIIYYIDPIHKWQTTYRKY
jgi:hypothetical protein